MNSKFETKEKALVAKSRPKPVKKAGGPVYFLLRIIFKIMLFFKYNFHFDRSISKKIKAPCLIISNHITVLDQFIIGSGFKFPINFVCSDYIVRKSFAGDAIRILARPIPIRKGSADTQTVKDIINIISKKGAVALFPEGNATFYGATSNFKPTIGKLAKKLNVPLVIMEIRGGYNTEPRWKNKKISKGKVDAYVKRVVEPSEMDFLTGDEINDIIEKEMYFNEFDYNRQMKIKFKGKHKAEDIESTIFACPDCHSLVDLQSQGNDLFCKRCGSRVRFNDYGFFEKVHKAEFWPDNVLDMSKIQLNILLNTNFDDYFDTPLFSDHDVTFFRCRRGQYDQVLGRGDIAFFADRIEVCGKTLHFDDISDTTLQRGWRLQIYLTDGDYLAVDCKRKSNLAKYMIAYYVVKNRKNHSHSTFYGY